MRRTQSVGTALERVEYPLGATIIKEGDVGDAMFILESGTVRLDMEHKDFSTKLTGPTSFGEMALITSKPERQRSQLRAPSCAFV